MNRKMLPLLILIPIFFNACVNITIKNPSENTGSLKDDSEFVTWEDLESGRADPNGYGLTVFKGTEVEKFYVTYDGVIPHPIFADGKAILVRLGSPLEGSNVLHGMSGSPVYFKIKKTGKWKLAGAMAFSFGGGTVGPNVAGVTPIQLMLNQEKALGINYLEESSKQSGILFRPIKINGQNGSKINILQPVITEISSSNKDAELKNSEVVAPKPGDAVTMLFSDGDRKMGGTCTVTYVTKDRFWLCGHPVLWQGKIITPAFRASIATSYKAPDYAFKMVSNQLESVGYVSYDNTFAVEGEIKPLPKNSMFPVKTTLSIKGKEPVEINYRVIRDKTFTKMLIGRITEEMLGSLWKSKETATIKSTAKINFDDQSLKLSDVTLDGPPTAMGPFLIRSNPWNIVSRAADAAEKLMSSEWGFNVKNIEAEISIEPGDKILYLDSYKLVNTENEIVNSVKLGKEIILVLGLRNNDGSKQFVRKIPLNMPEKLQLPKERENNLEIPFYVVIQSGNNFQEEDENELLGHKPDNKKEFLKELSGNQRSPANIYVQVVIPDLEPAPEEKKLFEKYGLDWNKVDKLNSLRSLKLLKRKVVLKEIESPLENYALEAKEKIDNLRLIIKENSPVSAANPDAVNSNAVSASTESAVNVSTAPTNSPEQEKK